MMTVMITGGTGMIGTLLSKKLVEGGNRVVILTRNAAAKKITHPSISFSDWDPAAFKIDQAALTGVDHIVHLAGAGIADRRWTNKRKQEIVDSRVRGGELLVRALRDHPNQVRSLISGSAIGIYGPGSGSEGSNGFEETDPPFNDFLASTCRKWEASVAPASSLGKRVVIFRAGIVLSPRGGALEKFRRPLKFGIVPVLGTGRQIISWIHVGDLIEMYLLAMKNDHVTGTFNAVAPGAVTNLEFMHTLKRIEKKWGISIPVPSPLLKIALGEMSLEVLKSAKVSSDKISSTGFKFRFPQLEKALADLIQK
jgi:uncharacterized protein (TIGR01777 family)